MIKYVSINGIINCTFSKRVYLFYFLQYFGGISRQVRREKKGKQIRDHAPYVPAKTDHM